MCQLIVHLVTCFMRVGVSSISFSECTSVVHLKPTSNMMECVKASPASAKHTAVNCDDKVSYFDVLNAVISWLRSPSFRASDGGTTAGPNFTQVTKTSRTKLRVHANWQDTPTSNVPVDPKTLAV